jgi:ABC-type transport system involved in cytochrome c biogenesis permease component
MNIIKRILGVVWMLLSPSLIYFLATQAISKIGAATEATKANVTLQWAIILIIFTPICIGFFIFGYYAVKGEYDHLPESSADLA